MRLRREDNRVLEVVEVAGIVARPDDIKRLRIERLGQYNAERNRGIVHQDWWVAMMREEQAWFDQEMHRGY